MRPRISVILPVYNHACELAECIASLRRQTLSPAELIVVDDGSHDQSSEVALEEKHRGGPWEIFHILRQPNRGAAAARNAGFPYATGSFVLFSDADIVWEMHAFEVLVAALQSHPEAAFAYSAFYFGWKLFRSGPFDSERLKAVNYIHTSALLRREHFPGFDSSLKRFQDWDLWLTLLQQGKRGVWIPEPLFRITPRAAGGMSQWLPSAIHRIPWLWLRRRIPELRHYDQAAAVIRRKHEIG